MEERSLNELFHLIQKALPEEQDLIKILPDTQVGEALEIMDRHDYSQLVVATGRRVMGVFSYRSLSNKLISLTDGDRHKLLSLPVDIFTEDLRFVNIKEQMDELIEELNLNNAFLLGTMDNPLGIITTIDMLNYFYSVARPYVMLFEIELALRELIRASVNGNELCECIASSLTSKYQELNQELPTILEQLTMADYASILRFKGHWHRFKTAFGGTTDTVYAKLEPLHEIRNMVFHFRGEPSAEDYEHLRFTRDWLLKRIAHIDELRKEGN